MTAPAPTTAERIRSTCVRAGGAMLAIEGVEPAATAIHHLLDDGSFAITVPADGVVADMVVAAGTAGVQAVLEMTDYAPLPLREPVRSLVWIRGGVQSVADNEIAGLLDLIAAAEPNPALLQVNTADRADGDTPLCPGTARGGVGRRRRFDGCGGRRGQRAAAGPTRPVLRDGVMLAAAPRGGPSRGDRPAGRPAADDVAARAGSVRSGSTGTAYGCGWRTKTAITTCGWRSPNPSTTSPG